jgi:hypothetical protein
MSVKKVLEFETTIGKIIKKNEELARFKVDDKTAISPEENADEELNKDRII